METVSNKKYVVLRGIELGNVFWTTNTAGEDPRFLGNGVEAYEILLFTDDDNEAKALWTEKSGFGWLVDAFESKVNQFLTN